MSATKIFLGQLSVVVLIVLAAVWGATPRVAWRLGPHESVKLLGRQQDMHHHLLPSDPDPLWPVKLGMNPSFSCTSLGQ